MGRVMFLSTVVSDLKKKWEGDACDWIGVDPSPTVLAMRGGSPSPGPGECYFNSMHNVGPPTDTVRPPCTRSDPSGATEPFVAAPAECPIVVTTEPPAW